MENKHTKVFLELLRAGLWEQDAQLFSYGEIDFLKILQLAEEQSVVGQITAGLEYVTDIVVPQDELITFIVSTLQIEEQNKAMNSFIDGLVERMYKADIYTLLVKGQGVAQCYERPLWRACGDVDLFLSEENYLKAKDFFTPILSFSANEGVYEKHLGMVVDNWSVELHGSLRCGLSVKMDEELTKIQKEVFKGGDVRSWMNGKTQVFLPGANFDILFVFTHFIKHFYLGGLAIRQICDWCRLMWTYRDEIDKGLLECRLKSMGLMTEWKAFGAFAVGYLGMPVEAMPLYSSESKWKLKADKILSFVMEVGNEGHKRNGSYFEKYPYVIRKAMSLRHRCADLIGHAWIFPMDSLRFFPNIMFHGLMAAVRGE